MQATSQIHLTRNNDVPLQHSLNYMQSFSTTYQRRRTLLDDLANVVDKPLLTTVRPLSKAPLEGSLAVETQNLSEKYGESSLDRWIRKGTLERSCQVGAIYEDEDENKRVNLVTTSLHDTDFLPKYVTKQRKHDKCKHAHLTSCQEFN